MHPENDTGAKTLGELQSSGSWKIYIYGEGLPEVVTFRCNYYGVDDGTTGNISISSRPILYK